MHWTDLTPPEWLEPDLHQWQPEIKRTSSLQPYEKEFFRKDGSRVPVVIGAASFEEGGEQGVAFVLDLTGFVADIEDRKRAEEALQKAIVALARRLAVIMHRMWSDGTEFRRTKEDIPAAA